MNIEVNNHFSVSAPTPEPDPRPLTHESWIDDDGIIYSLFPLPSRGPSWWRVEAQTQEPEPVYAFHKDFDLATMARWRTETVGEDATDYQYAKALATREAQPFLAQRISLRRDILAGKAPVGIVLRPEGSV